ncbi:MAG: beta-carotene hydroxylase [Hyphomicrobiaceae bacterium]|jgi:beta-carotene hydroxylase
MSSAARPTASNRPDHPDHPDRPDRPNRAEQRAEMAIAKKYQGRVPWEMVAWGLGNTCVWMTIWPLTFSGVLPLWVAFIASTICITLSYLPSHEAQHSIIGAEGTSLRWLNQLVGHVSTIPLVLPYRIAWITHRRHHAHANDPELDPDRYNAGANWWESVWHGILGRQPGAQSAYRTLGQESGDPEIARALVEGVAMSVTYYAILAGLAWSGYALEALFVWWLPRQIATSYIQLFLSWAPHYPMEEKGRYRDTRAWRSPIGTIATMGMEYHIIHHLYPSIPLIQTGPAYWEMRDLLVARGCRIDGL